MFYASDEAYLAALVPFVVEGLHAEEPVAVAVPEPRLRLLRSAMGDGAQQVTWINMLERGRNPGRIIPGVLRRFADAHQHRHVRIIGEPVWPDRTDTEYPACAQHEALINPAFAGRDVTIVCPYDTVHLAADVITDAHATHPEIWEDDHRYDSLAYAPDAVIAHYNQPLDRPTTAVEFQVTALSDISLARQWARHHGLRLGLSADRADDFELIVSELVTNSLQHAHSPSLVRLWRTPEHLCCEVHDTGHITEPLAGRKPPGPQPTGRGLLLVHQLADLVRTHTTPSGTRQYALLDL